MKKVFIIILCFAVICAIFYISWNFFAGKQMVRVIPEPVKIEFRLGSFRFDKTTKTTIFYNLPEAEKLAAYLANDLKENLKASTETSKSDLTDSKGIYLILDQNFKSQNNEGYDLQVTRKKIVITSMSEHGIFNGIQTLRQLYTIPVNISNQSVKVKCVYIQDYPRFAWRGMHLDVSRHFQSKEFIKTYIDILAAHKLNVFHWHLTDDQGWRIEIKKYPKLTQISAWHVDRNDEDWDMPDSLRKPVDPSKPLYGGFYTQDDIKEIVSYAQDRFIEIVPEIEMPGHSQEVLAAYPELSCSGKPYKVQSDGGEGFSDPLCAGNEATFDLIEGVLSEVIELFPSQYIHIGGDECKKDPWEKCPKCQKRMKQENITKINDLQNYFTRRIEKFLVSKNKKLIGWDEILEGELGPESTVMSWRGEDGGIQGAKEGHDVVMTPTDYCYFDYYQLDSALEPKSPKWAKPSTMKHLYSYNPVPLQLTKEQGEHILGVQACLWSEYALNPELVEIKVLPRLCALSEIAWTPVENKNWKKFVKKMKYQYARFDTWNYKYFKADDKYYE